MAIQHSIGNVFSDIGCRNPAALQLKARLMIAIDNHIKARNQLVNSTLPSRVHSLLDQQFNAFSLDEIVELAAAIEIRMKFTSSSIWLVESGFQRELPLTRDVYILGVPVFFTNRLKVSAFPAGPYFCQDIALCLSGYMPKISPLSGVCQAFIGPLSGLAKILAF